MAQATTQYRVESNGVAVITLSYPPLNALHPQRKAGIHKALNCHEEMTAYLLDR